MTTNAILPLKYRFRRLLRRLEPWYSWGTADTYRLDSLTADFDDEVLGEVRYFTIQWLALHFGISFGRTPTEGR